MKNIILLIVPVLFFIGCTKKQPIIVEKIKYRTQIKYIYLPCIDKKKKQDISKNIIKKKNKHTRSILAQADIKDIKKNIKIKKRDTKKYKKSVFKKHIKYFRPKSTKIFAPKKYIKTANKKMDFMIGINKDKTEFVYLEGSFGINTYKNFIKFLKQSATTAKEIKINSNGGLVSTAMQIGAYIHDNGWNTGVDKEMRCLSACGFVYFAGKEKSLEDSAIIGLHRPYYTNKQDTIKNIRKIKKDYISYWNYIQASKTIYDEMMSVNRDELFILDKNNIEEYIDVNLI